MQNCKSKLKIFILLLFFIHFFFANNAQAQVPSPYVPCNKTDSPEFHSLRPYQASPCNENVEEVALFCGNDLILDDSFTVKRNQAKKCTDNGDGTETCDFVIDRTKEIAIDLSGADLPIMGNTELVTNSQDQPDPEKLPDSNKVNEYLSWYLNGTINRAEYPFLNPENPEDVAKIIDFSGPLRKLLPQEIQTLARVDTIKKAKKKRHDQVVGCTYGINILGKILGGVPAPCYEDKLLNFPKEEHRLSTWKNNLPPLRSDFDRFEDYWEKYVEWRGKLCPTLDVPDWLPIIGGKKLFIFCGLENPFKPNFYANLFPYVPFSSTEDRKGQVETETTTVQPVSPGMVVSNVSFDNQLPAELFFAHMQETSELTRLLQQTFVPQEGDLDSFQVTDVSPPQYCDLARIRTNPGDDLFAGEISGRLSYTANFSCTFDKPDQPPPATGGEQCRSYGFLDCYPQDYSCEFTNDSLNDCGQGYVCGMNCTPPQINQECTQNAKVSLSLITKTPKADEAWTRTVSGPTAVFKRIFPKIGAGGPLLAILDIPAATKVSYTSLDGTPIIAGNPGNQRDGESAELYFPHLGSIHEYFLKGIQTLLRPKGYGEQIISGQPGTVEVACASGEVADSLPDLPSASSSCKLGTTGAYGAIPNLPPTLVKIIEAAAESYQIPSSLILGIMFGEGAFNRPYWQWTEENVVNWSLGCATMPQCDPNNPSSQGPFQLFESEWEEHKDGVKAVDPAREPNRCNFMDQVFAVARKVAKEATGWSGYPPPQSCFGIPFNLGSGGPSSCSNWDKSDVNTGIRQWAGACFSNSGSGSGGAGAGDCPLDNCETYNQCFGGSGGCSSHSYFVWSIYLHYR